MRLCGEPVAAFRIRHRRGHDGSHPRRGPEPVARPEGSSLKAGIGEEPRKLGAVLTFCAPSWVGRAQSRVPQGACRFAVEGDGGARFSFQMTSRGIRRDRRATLIPEAGARLDSTDAKKTYCSVPPRRTALHWYFIARATPAETPARGVER